MADVTILFTGYNSITQTYNTGGYNEDVAFPALTSALGSVTSTGDTTVTVTGVSADATAGNTSESAGGGISVGVTGLSLTGSCRIYGASMTTETAILISGVVAGAVQIVKLY